jgi:2-hydroxychromene-2-carboxylate isomerase
MSVSEAPEVQAEYQRYTDDAPADGVFGSPFYLYGGDILWGQDRLDFLAEALAARTGGPRP